MSTSGPVATPARGCRDLGWDRAFETAGRAADPLPPVVVPLSDALGRSLAGDVIADVALPVADCAAMDGYATAGTGPWVVVGQQVTGPPTCAPLTSGQAVEIATGAMVPAGCDRVLPYEQAVRVDGLVAGQVEVGRHIRRRGEDIASGGTLCRSGEVVTPAMCGLLSACGSDRVMVRQRPRVSILTTGAEIVMSGAPRPGWVRDAITPMMAPLVSRFGAEVCMQAHVPGGRDELAAAIAEVAEESDVVVVAGSSSRGATDHLRSLVQPAEFLVDGVECRPGHPQLLARLSGPGWVIGLPGNPFAALVTVYTLLRPLLDGMTGRSPVPALALKVTGRVVGRTDRTRLVPVRLTGDGSVKVIEGHGPANLLGAAVMDGLSVLPIGWTDGTPARFLPA